MKHTPRQRAEAALTTAEARVARLTKILERVNAEADTTHRRLTEAEERRDFLAQDPALKQDTTSTGADA